MNLSAPSRSRRVNSKNFVTGLGTAKQLELYDLINRMMNNPADIRGCLIATLNTIQDYGFGNQAKNGKIND